jgi:uncharacterized membrane protein YfcA
VRWYFSVFGGRLVERLIQFAVIGFIAQMIDGSVGMGYGMTSSSLLLAGGVAPATASASVHMAKILTGVASGGAHWRMGNVDWALVLPLAIPGGIGAFFGAFFLTAIPVDTAKILVASVLFALGLYVLYRFTIGRAHLPKNAVVRRRFLAPLGVIGGFVDSTGGGGWGPISTSTLLAKTGRPRKVIGSVSVAEIAVAVCSTLGFLISLGPEGIELGWFAALVGGGLVAAPIAAWLVKHIQTQRLGLLIAGFILLTNARTMAILAGADDRIANAFFGVIVALWCYVVFHAVTERRKAIRASANERRGDLIPVEVFGEE